MRTIKIRYILKTISFIILLTPSISSQGQFIKDGYLGIGIGLSHQSNNEVDILVGELGASFDAKFDLNFAFGSTSKGTDLNIYALSFEFFPLKEERNNNPFTLSLSATLQHNSSGRGWKRSTQESYSIGVAILKNITISQNIIFQPYLGWSFHNILTVNEGDQGLYHFGFSLFPKFKGKNLFVLNSSAVTDFDQTTVSIGLGYIFTFKGHRIKSDKFKDIDW